MIKEDHKITYKTIHNMNSMGFLVPINYERDKSTQFKHKKELFRLYPGTTFFSKNTNFNLIETILPIAIRENKRINILIFSCNVFYPNDDEIYNIPAIAKPGSKNPAINILTLSKRYISNIIKIMLRDKLSFNYDILDYNNYIIYAYTTETTDYNFIDMYIGQYLTTSKDAGTSGVSKNPDTLYGPYTGYVTTLSGSPFPPHPMSGSCFIAGTNILTDQGTIPIEKIDKNINTINNKQILAITQTIYTASDYLVVFEKDSLGDNIPSEKTVVTKEHGIYLKNDQFFRAKLLLDNLDNVYKYDYDGEILYNVLMEEHSKIVANNMICETLKPTHELAKLFYDCNGLSDIEKNKIIEEHNKKYVNRIKNQGY